MSGYSPEGSVDPGAVELPAGSGVQRSLTLTQRVAENARSLGTQIPHTSCPYCNGHGWMPLAPHLLTTWGALDAEKGQIAAEVAEKLNVTASAAATRLNQLCGLGLAVVVRMRPGESGRSKPAAEWVRAELPEEETGGRGTTEGAGR